MKSLGICHRDMSLENILLTDGGAVCKIMDFGMSLLMPVNPINGNSSLLDILSHNNDVSK